MKVIWRLIRTFFISIITLWILSGSPRFEPFYYLLGVTKDSTKEKLVAILSTLFVGVIFELLPYLFRKYIADKIKISVTYLKNRIPVNKLEFIKISDVNDIEQYKTEVVKIAISLSEGTSIGYRILKMLNAKVFLKYNPDLFTTIDKYGNIIENNKDGLFSRDSKGAIYMDIFNGYSSVGDYSSETEFSIVPNYPHINKSNLAIKIKTDNFFTGFLAKICVEIINDKLILGRKED